MCVAQRDPGDSTGSSGRRVPSESSMEPRPSPGTREEEMVGDAEEMVGDAEKP